MNQQELGAYGEQLAQQLLRSKNYQILATNYRFGKLEVDIVSLLENQLVIVEVKTRQTAEIGEPWRAVTRSKQKQIIKAANGYIFEKNIHFETRFDIISIVHNSFRTDIEHLEDAFGPIC
jgi:putative endonuclease